MAMPALRRRPNDWTVDEILALPFDGRRHECLDGVHHVTPAPSWGHQRSVERLFLLVAPYTQAHRIGWTKLSPADLIFSPQRLLQPDLFVVPWRDEGEPTAWSQVEQLLLTVEVLSPSTARVDRILKRAIYADEGVPEYWIINGAAGCIERWRPQDEQPERVTGLLRWAPSPHVPPLDIDVEALFA
jgi:Uma2 family endonuclease